ncbi:MAG: methylmalonyl Co-A mutase-associated GTPase MeaB [Thermodesulfobacteriales bacterium]|nr:MAG: methylmalonyl Co-A mutase-associated GTPase MeaB [Thermodesulfobacteriales bacterium]
MGTTKKKRELSFKEYTEGILCGNRSILSQAITLVESTLPKHSELAQKIINHCLPHTGKSIRIGITGIPGVGKSTFIETFGLYLTGEEKRTVAVLAIDPTSELSKGSILGDKVRMEKLSLDQNAFIRPSPTSGSLGGVAQSTRETILLCEAAGFNTVIVETVGVGQSEIAVDSMVDFFLLLLLAGAGDEIQGMKRGIMEMADTVAITKADGDNISRAQRARKEFENAIHLFPHKESGWVPEVTTCSSLANKGIKEIWKTVIKHQDLIEKSGILQHKRQEQTKRWMHEAILYGLKKSFYSNEDINKTVLELEKKVIEGEKSPFTAANELLAKYFKNIS